MRLLIVDDSNIIRTRIARVAADWRASEFMVVGMARNGIEGLRLAAAHRPDVVTMDLTMPEMDGIECVERLVEMLPEVKVLVVSALSDKATALQALKRGAQGFLYKPFTEAQLGAALTELVS
ncbi:response regulator transcription factor [Derxia lacustris]|uniref:response regulator transcription factor n=1 Tax=Derxia lacustris TaxID=764842 RepID=UPI000A176104|nr:response regulator [Derxia lacustris]